MINRKKERERERERERVRKRKRRRQGKVMKEGPVKLMMRQTNW
jgi:hypothetical protein